MSLPSSSPKSPSIPLDLDDEDESDSERTIGPRQIQHLRQASHQRPYFLLVCSIAITSIFIGFIGGTYFQRLQSSKPSDEIEPQKSCKDPALRREWRSLDTREKRDYIRAVKCLKTTPSQLQLNQTLYDDFPWVHKHFGEYSHDAAPFLAWHRYFIHTYERKLQEQCGYKGHLTYWDWTLDWENITVSPIWDIEIGFGGSGNVSMGSPVFKAYCVAAGPFANLEVPYFEDIYQPHCLLRGFDEHLEDFREDLRPEALSKLLLSPDYRSINLGLEHGPHIAIPKSINGDFSLHTAPSDPVFFLHHAQLDRMWWRWQQARLAQRAFEYNGKASTKSIEKASLTDIMPMGGLASDITVSEIMSTESNLLCYMY